MPSNSRKSGTEQNGQGMKREAGRWVERRRNEKDEWMGWGVREGKVLLLDFFNTILQTVLFKWMERFFCFYSART